MALSGQVLFFNYGDLQRRVKDSADPVLKDKRYTDFNANVSFSYRRGPLRAIFTANSLLDFYSKDDGIEEPVNLRNYIGTLEYTFKTSKESSITPTATYVLEEDQRRDLFDIGAKFSYVFNPEIRLWLRASYRGYLNNGNFEYVAFTPIIGIDRYSWKLSYSYDVDMGKYSSYYRGGHQIRLGIKLFCKSACRCDYDKDDEWSNVIGLKENNGYPWKDTDNDGVLDKDDNCVNEAGAKENNGCSIPAPLVVTKEVQEQLNRYTKNILLDTGKSSLKDASTPILVNIIIILQKTQMLSVL